MIPLFNSSQIRNFDSYAIKKLNIPGVVLMENAAIGIYQTLIERVSDIYSVGIVCGKGNNGGDGFALARHFSNAGIKVNVISLGLESQMSEDCRVNYKILKNLSNQRKNLKIKFFNSLKDITTLKYSSIIVDAMLGSGFTGELKEPYSSIIKTLNKFSSFKCAIDVPTGLNADSGDGSIIFNSDLTVTLGENKKGLFIYKGYENCGEIVLKEIGIGFDYFDKIETKVYLLEPEDVYSFLPKRGKTVHKYNSGRVLTIAGSYKYPGAASLASISSLIAGSGSSILAVPESIKKLVHKNLLEVVVESYGDNKTNNFTRDALRNLSQKIKWADVVAIGPGLNRNKETVLAIREFIQEKKFKFSVIDADAIYALSQDSLRNINLSNCILTPHLGEFSQLIGTDIKKIEKDLIQYGSEFAIKNSCVLVLKGAPSIIFNKNGEVFINSTGNSGLAKFGTGDVLTGVIAGLLSQCKNPDQAALMGVYLHSLSADLLLRKKSISNILASDVMNNYPAAVKFLEGSIV